ncbi:MAG: pantoate--beta-alanine ligase [Leptospira sp.]|nr:pantoate--beta-alanine ligase [Leptospira sp.]NCS95641.1 pantoate--beta-alanine ligase [Leptospira sp.]
MLILNTKLQIQEALEKSWSHKDNIGFIPTMGYLHEGHLTLVRESKIKDELVVVSIFVNPAQFNQNDDYTNYPKSIEKDIEMLKSEGVDILYIPEMEDFYPNSVPNIKMQLPGMMDHLCGATRPGHFDGVLLVLSKFFHIIKPNNCYMGLKDFQQFKIVKRFAEILNFPIDIIGIETVREVDGLAMSSRNARLSIKEREAANLIQRSLKLGEKLINEGERDLLSLKEIISDVIKSSSLLKIDYLEIVDPDTLVPITSMQNQILIATAVFVGSVRLIDNILIDMGKG